MAITPVNKIHTNKTAIEGQIAINDIWLRATSLSASSIGVKGIIADNNGSGQGRYSTGKNVPDRKIIGNITALPKPDPAAGEFAQEDRINPMFMNTIVPIITITYMYIIFP